MVLSLWESSRYWASKSPAAVCVMVRYKSKGRLGYGGMRTGGWVRYCLIRSKDYWQASFQTLVESFRRSLKISSQMEVSWLMNRLICCNFPRKPRTSFSVRGGGISSMALSLAGSASIPFSLIMNPKSFPFVTPKTQFYGLSLIWYCRRRLKNFRREGIWPSLVLDLIIILST